MISSEENSGFPCGDVLARVLGYDSNRGMGSHPHSKGDNTYLSESSYIQHCCIEWKAISQYNNFFEGFPKSDDFEQ